MPIALRWKEISSINCGFSPENGESPESDSSRKWLLSEHLRGDLFECYHLTGRSTVFRTFRPANRWHKDKIVSEFRRLRRAADVHPAPDEDSRRKKRSVRTVALAGKIRSRGRSGLLSKPAISVLFAGQLVRAVCRVTSAKRALTARLNWVKLKTV